MSKASISFFPNCAKKQTKNKKTPVYIRVILHGQKAEARLNLDLSEKENSSWNPIYRRVDIPNCPANNHISTIESEFTKFLAANDHKLTEFNAKQIRDIILSKKQPLQKPITVIDYCNNYYEKAISYNSNLSDGTKKNYRKAIKHFLLYSNQEKIAGLTPNSINYTHAEHFKSYLLNSKDGKVGMSEVSALGIIKKFRTIFEKAFEENLVQRNYFKLIKLKNKSPRKPRLTITQLKDIYELPEAKSRVENLCKDLLIFSSITGLAYCDVINLSKSSLQSNRADNEIKLVKARTKTEVQIEQFLPTLAQKLINKYESSMLANFQDRFFPYVDNSTYNKTLKLIAAKARISLNLTTHTGRHTFRQLLPEAQVEDSAVISRMMGKVGSDKIDNVYYEITESRLIDAKRKFDLFLNENLKTDFTIKNTSNFDKNRNRNT